MCLPSEARVKRPPSSTQSGSVAASSHGLARVDPWRSLQTMMQPHDIDATVGRCSLGATVR